MIPYDDIAVTPETREDIDAFAKEVQAFRAEGPLDKVSIAKLEEHFRAGHVYNSAAIEGNRLTLQETMLVLRDGVEVREKPLRDTLEVKNLGQAFDYLNEIVQENQPIRETDIRNLHKMVIGEQQDLGPGEYRKVGVIISGSEHRPPEPLEVPAKMAELAAWINENLDRDPIVVASIAHHELTAIHPFKDGNGRVSRLLMNLVLMKLHYPISNIKNKDKLYYYEALSFSDVGIYDPLVRLIKDTSAELFSEYQRIRTETKRTTEWAEKWGVKEKEVLRRREQREMELWLSRTNLIQIEFQQASELLNDKFEQIDIEFFAYRNAIDFERYQTLIERGWVDRANVFSITFRNRTHNQKLEERFMFRYYRNNFLFHKSQVIPLEVNYLDPESKKYDKLSESSLGDKVHLHYLYFTDAGEFTVRVYDATRKEEAESTRFTIAQAAQSFFDDVLHNVFRLKV